MLSIVIENRTETTSTDCQTDRLDAPTAIDRCAAMGATPLPGGSIPPAASPKTLGANTVPRVFFCLPNLLKSR
jgi:hypothetical protein